MAEGQPVMAALTELEEFEFRRRRERERAVAAPKRTSLMEDVPPVPGTPEAAAVVSQPLSEARTVKDRIIPGQITDMTKSAVVGAPEAALQLATGAGSSVVGGIAGTGNELLRQAGVQGLPESADVVRSIQERNTFQPRSQRGKEAAAMVAAPFEGVHNIAAAAGEKVADVAGPEAGATVQTLGDFAPVIAGMPRVAPKPSTRPAATVTHEVDSTGSYHTVKSNAGESTAVREGNVLREIRSDTAKEARGQGEATARVKRLIDEAAKEKVRFESDRSVTPEMARVYERLEAEGYEVKRNPAEVNPDTGNLVSSNPKMGVFEVTPLKPSAVSEGRAPTSGNMLRRMLDLFAGDEGVKRIVTRNDRRLIGSPEDVAKIATTAEQAPTLVAGSPPTVAQALSKEPVGTAILANESLIARQPSGPSARFGERFTEQKTARETARKQVEADLGPVRESVIQEANTKGAADANLEMPPAPGQSPHTGMKSGAVRRKIAELRTKPGTSEIAEKALDKVAERITEKTKETGLIDAADLYAVRKDIGKHIQDISETGVGKVKKGWSKGQTRALERQIQLVIDDAIEAAGGKGWKSQYMEPYARRMQAIEADKMRAEAVKKPAQKTSVGSIAEAGTPPTPHIFSRLVSIANYITKGAADVANPKIAAESARRLLNPKLFAKALREGATKPARPPAGVTRKAVGSVTMQTPEERRRRLAAQALRQ